ncbi:MAG: IclR family transcriptional regulator [Rhodoglobus sp.]
MSSSIDRALDVLEQIAVERLNAGELGTRLEVHRSTIVRLLQTLEARGYARRHADGKWGIGFGLIAIGQGELHKLDLREVAHPHIVALGHDMGHTVHLASLIGNDVIYVDKVDSDSAVRLQSRVGGRALVHTAGVAKAILAFAPDDVRAAAIESCTFEQFTPTTIRDADALLEELRLTRERGWAVDDSEAESFINCVALPLFGSGGAVVGSISVTAMKALVPLAMLETHLPRIIRTRDAICADLGFTGTASVAEKAS